MHSFDRLNEHAAFVRKVTAESAPAFEICIAWRNSMFSIYCPGGIHPITAAKANQDHSLTDAAVFS
jgi:hypothetical protein